MSVTEPESVGLLDFDRCFKQFLDYSFSTDEEFIRGWAGLRKSLENDAQDIALHYIRAKIFYFARKNDAHHLIPDLTSRLTANLTHKSNETTDANSMNAEGNEQLRPGAFKEDPDTELPSHSENDNNIELFAPDSKLSLGEVMGLLKDGKEIPGLEELNIEPSHENCPKSQIERPFKPWEVLST